MIDQILIAVCGVAAVFLSQDSREKWRRWACIFGLIAQPAWLYTTWMAQQWGIFSVCILYAIAWGVGFRRYWCR